MSSEELNLKGIDEHFHEDLDYNQYNFFKFCRLTGDPECQCVPVGFHYFGTKAPLLGEFNGFDTSTNVAKPDVNFLGEKVE